MGKKRKHKHMYTGSAYGDFEFTPTCHVGPKFVMRMGKARIWAGSVREMRSEMGWALRVRVTDVHDAAGTAVRLDDKAAALIPRALLETASPPTIDITWPDFDVPELNREWWENLTNGLENIDGDIGVYCIGGHGRTGTILSILAALSGNSPEGTDPVLWVRGQYCEDAVESNLQLDYVQEITGETVREQGSLQKKMYHKKSAADSAAVFDPGMPTWRELADGTWQLVTDAEKDQLNQDLKAKKDDPPSTTAL